MVSDLSPAEDASARELSNITIPDPPEDVQHIFSFGEYPEVHKEGAPPAPPEAFWVGVSIHEEDLAETEEEPGQIVWERETSEESNSSNTTQQDSSPGHHHFGAASWADEGEVSEEELTDELSEELTKESLEELALEGSALEAQASLEG